MYSTKNLNFLIITLMIATTVLIYYVWLFVVNNNKLMDSSNDKFIDLLTSTVPVRSVRRDCESVSMTDAQCATICRGPETYFTRNGACVNSNLKLNDDGSVVKRQNRNTCDPKRGVLAYLVGNSQFGSTEFECLSVDPSVQPDNVQSPNTILVNGTVPIDYLKKIPQFQDGVCNDPVNDIMITIPSTLT